MKYVYQFKIVVSLLAKQEDICSYFILENIGLNAQYLQTYKVEKKRFRIKETNKRKSENRRNYNQKSVKFFMHQKVEWRIYGRFYVSNFPLTTITPSPLILNNIRDSTNEKITERKGSATEKVKH